MTAEILICEITHREYNVYDGVKHVYAEWKPVSGSSLHGHATYGEEFPYTSVVDQLDSVTAELSLTEHTPRARQELVNAGNYYKNGTTYV